MTPDETAHNPAGIDTSVAHNARVWNYWLGGKDNFQADRDAGDRVRDMFPRIVDVARADRAFLARAVGFLVGQGLDQFLDVGTGLPTADNTHEVAQRLVPGARVVYVDNDPLVLTHARALLTSAGPGVTSYVDADVRRPAEIIAEAAATLDLARPVAVMMLGVLNFVLDDDQAATAAGQLMSAVPSGSYLAVSHPTTELGGEANKQAMEFWNQHATPPITARGRDRIVRFFDGLELAEPGVVPIARWRPDPALHYAPEVALYAGVARKP